MAAVLLEHLAEKTDLHIYSSCTRRQADGWASKTGCHVHPVSARNYWLAVGGPVCNLKPHTVLVVSGIHKARIIYPAFQQLHHKVAGRMRTLLLQAVNLDRRPGFLAKRLLRRFDAVLCSSKTLANDLASLLEKPVTYLPPAVDAHRIESIESAVRGDKLRVAFMNHVNHQKGADIAVKAFAELRLDNAEYIVAGTGDCEASLRAQYEGTPGIRFLGYLPDPLPELKSCDVMVLPFRTSVSVLGVSQTLLECMAAGVPVIATRHDTITAVLEHEKQGLLVDDAEGLKAAIKRLYNDRDLRLKLSANAQHSVDDFEVSRVTDRLCSMI